MATVSRVEVPGSETYGFRKPTRTSGLEGLAKMHSGEDSNFEHAVVAFNPDLTREEIEKNEAELAQDLSVVKHEGKPGVISLKGKKIEFFMNRVMPFFNRKRFVKISSLQLQVVCLQSMRQDANEVNIVLEDRRGPSMAPIRTMMTTTNKGERFAFDMDFSVARRDFKRIVLHISRTTLNVKDNIQWGELSYKAILTLSNHPKLSDITPVVGKTLLPQGALNEHVYDPTRQDKRLSQAGLDALSNIKNTIKNETVVNRGGTLVVRKAGTIAAGSSAGAGANIFSSSKYMPHQLDEIEEEDDSPEALKAQYAQISLGKEIQKNRQELYTKLLKNDVDPMSLDFGLMSPTPPKIRSPDMDTMSSARFSDGGVVVPEPAGSPGMGAEGYAKEVKSTRFRSEPSIIPSVEGKGKEKAESIRSQASRYRDSNPFKESMLREADELEGYDVTSPAMSSKRKMTGAIPYLPTSIP